MKNKVLSLTKVFLKNSFKNMKSQNKKQQSKFKKILMIIMYILLIIYLSGVIGFMSYNLIKTLMTVHQEQVFLGVFFLAIAFLIIFQSIFSSMNVMYFSKDLEFVLPLPLKPKEILIAKINTILVTEYVTESIFGLLPLILYGILTNASYIYYLASIIILLIFPILPLVISSFIVMIIMSFSKLTKNQDKMQIIGTAIVIAMAIGMQMFLNTGTKEVTDQQVIDSLMKANGLVEIISSKFITLKSTINALTTNSLVNSMVEIFKITIITVVSYIIFINLGQKLYFKGAIGNISGSVSKKAKLNTKNLYKKRKVSISYVKKEFKILFRNPIYFIQCVTPPILMPLLFTIIGYKSIESAGNINDIVNSIGNIYNIYTVCGILGAIQFLSMMIYISATAVSRDGLNATFIKYIPVTLYKQFIYKAIPNLIMNTFTILIVLALVYIITKVSLIFLTSIFIIAMLLNVIHSYLMEIVDLKNPKLEWDTEYAVVKQNLNLIWPAILGIVNISILALVGFILSKINLIVAIIICMLLYGIIVYLIDRYVFKNQTRLFEKVF